MNTVKPLLCSLSLLALMACSTPPAPLNDPKLQQAQALQERGDLTGAAELYRELATEHRQSIEPELPLAIIYRKLGRTEDALTVMEDAMQRQPENPDVRLQYGHALTGAGKTAEAVAVFDKLIEENPGNIQAYSGKGIAFDRSGNHLAAQELYTKALALEPSALSIQNNLGMSLILNDQLDAAIEVLEKLSVEAPQNKTVRQNLALAYGLKGNHKKALALNMKDIPPEQARENLKFYQKYRTQKKTHTKGAVKVDPDQIGFEETPPEKQITKPERTEKAAAKKTVKPKLPTPPVVETAPEGKLPTVEAAKPAPIAAPAPDAPAAAEPAAELTPQLLERTELPTRAPNAAPSPFPSQPRR